MYSKNQILDKDLWKSISNSLKRSGHNMPIKSIKSQMESLKQEYKRCKDHNNQSDVEPKMCEYYEELDEIFCKKPWIKPLSIAGSNKRADDDSKSSKRAKTSAQAANNECKKEWLELKKAEFEFKKEQERKKEEHKQAIVKLLEKITESLKK